MDKGAERYLASIRASNIELVDVLNVRARVAFGFDEGLPLASEPVEVVDQISAHESLHGCIDRAQIDLLLRGLVDVHIGIKLRYGRKVRGNRRRNLRPLRHRAEKREDVLRKEGRIVVAGPI